MVADAFANPSLAVEPALSVEDVFERHADFVWRSLRRLGVADAQLDDAVQDVFVVVHRQRDRFAHRASLKTWLFSIAMRVASDVRRRHRRKGGTEELPLQLPDPAPGPEEHAERGEALRQLDHVLAQLEEKKRVVFILAELEQMTGLEMAEVLGENPNTLASRLRAARQDFADIAARLRGGLR